MLGGVGQRYRESPREVIRKCMKKIPLKLESLFANIH